MTRREAKALRGKIERAAQTQDDETALDSMELFPTYESLAAGNVTAEKGSRFRYGGKLWRVEQPSFTFDGQYAPNVGTESIFSEVVLAGTGESAGSAIPYNGNMALENGKYYTQDGVIYHCIRDTVAPVYNSLQDLVGIYVERSD